MDQQLHDWKSFWDLATPERAAAAFVELYGPNAASAAAGCALTADADNRQDDYRFWISVFRCLKSSSAGDAISNVPSELCSG